MNVRTFLNELLFYYPLNRKEEELEKLMNAYVEDILRAINQYPKHNCDFQKLLQNFRMSYKYQKFPSPAEIIMFLPSALSLKESFSGQEGQTIKRVIRGRVYEFTIVPKHWDVKTISELDADIARRYGKNNNEEF